MRAVGRRQERERDRGEKRWGKGRRRGDVRSEIKFAEVGGSIGTAGTVGTGTGTTQSEVLSA